MQRDQASRTEWVLPVAGAVTLVLVWEVLCQSGAIRSIFLPAPSAVATALGRNVSYVVISALVTLRDIGIGYLFGCSLGVVVGVLVGYCRPMRQAIAPLLLVISPIPIVTFLPLFIIWFGLNIIPVLCCAFVAAFFPTLINTISGVRNVDPAHIEVAKNFGADGKAVLVKVVLPAASPHIANGLRLSIQLCFLVTPVAEMIMGDIGMGGLIWRSADLFKTELVLVGQLTLGVMGLSLFAVFEVLERRILLRWRRPEGLE